MRLLSLKDSLAAELLPQKGSLEIKPSIRKKSSELIAAALQKEEEEKERALQEAERFSAIALNFLALEKTYREKSESVVLDFNSAEREMKSRLQNLEGEIKNLEEKKNKALVPLCKVRDNVEKK